MQQQSRTEHERLLWLLSKLSKVARQGPWHPGDEGRRAETVECDVLLQLVPPEM